MASAAHCAQAGCPRPGLMVCPVCRDQGRPDFNVCSQEHLVSQWIHHSPIHSTPVVFADDQPGLPPSYAAVTPAVSAANPNPPPQQHSQPQPELDVFAAASLAQSGAFETNSGPSVASAATVPADDEDEDALFASLYQQRHREEVAEHKNDPSSLPGTSLGTHGSSTRDDARCGAPGCGRPGDFQCPVCKEFGLPPFYVCSNEHLVHAWPSHSPVHARAGPQQQQQQGKVFEGVPNAAAGGSNLMVLTVQPLDQPRFNVEIDADASVFLLKQAIATAKGIPVDRQRLITAGSILENDSELLSLVGLGPGSIVQLAVRSAPPSGSAAGPAVKVAVSLPAGNSAGLPVARPLGPEQVLQLQQQAPHHTIGCPTCSAQLVYPQHAATIRCPRCQSILAVPGGIQRYEAAPGGGPHSAHELLMTQQVALPPAVDPAPGAAGGGANGNVNYVSCIGCAQRLSFSPNNHVIQCPKCSTQMRVGGQPQLPSAGAGGAAGNPSVLQNFLHTLVYGAEFLKFGRSGSPHMRRVRLNQLRDHLTWGSNAIRLTELTHVEPGTGSKIFQRSANRKMAHPERCFTIYAKHRSLDLQASSTQERDAWVAGLRAIIQDLGARQRAAAHSHFMR